MRGWPKNKRTTVLLLVLVAVAAIAAIACGITSTRSAMRVGYAGNEGRSSWSGHYVLLDGTMQKSVYADGDTLDVAVETQSGTISIAITDTAGNVIFDEQDIGTESFAVEAAGKVVVRITADHHKGSFQISG